VMIDDESAAQKFPAITEWTGPDYLDYLDEEDRTFVQGTGENQTRNSREVLVGGDYYDTMLARLYLEDAEGLEHYRLVHESSRYSIVGFFGNVQASQRIGVFEDVAESESENATSLADTIANFAQARAGNFGVPLGPGQTIHDPYVASSVKTFERVEGATLTGETDLNGSVEVTVPMRTATNRTFTYSNSAPIEDGSFEVTVPYPTDESLMPEDGYANASVRADGEYTLTAFNESGTAIEEATNVTVPETEIQTGGSVDVELVEIPDPPEPSLSGLDIAGQGNDSIIAPGEEEPVSVTVENVGEEAGEFTTSLAIGQNVSASETTDTLEPNETTTLTFENVTGNLSTDIYVVEVSAGGDSVTGQLVVDQTANSTASRVSNLDIAGEGNTTTITQGTNESITVEVENIGEEASEFTPTLALGEQFTTSATTAELEPGETTTVTYENVTGNLDPNVYIVEVLTDDDSALGELTVEVDSSVSAGTIPGRLAGTA
jgi:hypothetical protein